MKRIYIALLPCGFVWLISSCEIPYDIRVTKGYDHYVVDGSITNLPGPYIIKLTHSAAYSVKSEGSNYPVRFATVCIIDDSIKDHPQFLCELGDGKYRTDSLFRAIPGHSYSLYIQTVNGIELMSYPEQMPPVPEAIITHNEFVDETIFHPEGHKVWITLTDVPNVKNYYQWTYQGVYLFSTGIYSSGDILRPHPSACWMYEYFYFDFNLESDRLFDGQTFDRDITVVPYFSASPYLLTIYTRSL
ncbi:MAG TPA: DUF4249 family protein, partial [Cyclobacteriaceae bacterium]|nr:DUF4249 family protein [Cyclobacteriaceae bacterium]